MIQAIIQEKLYGYARAKTRAEKTVIVNAVAQVTGMHRKAVIRALARELKRSKQKQMRTQGTGLSRAPVVKQGRPPIYTAETEAALAWVWEQYNYPSAERLHPIIPEAVRIFRRDGMWKYSSQSSNQLLAMSLGAMKLRTVAMSKAHGLLRGQSTTRSGPLLAAIPVFFGSWKRKSAGYGQIDTVVHSGPKLMGTMAYTVNYIDVATYWQIPVAQLGKDDETTRQSISTIASRLPWLLQGLHPDSGSEFVNEVLLAWCRDRHIELTRSRPSKKNDNCYIEQRNRTLVRAYVGYERYDCQEAVSVMNELYAVLTPYVNFFQPTYKLVRKEKRVNSDGKQVAKPYQRIYDTPSTPYARALKRPEITDATKEKLKAQYETLNPKVLRDKIQALTTKLERIQRELGYHF